MLCKNIFYVVVLGCWDFVVRVREGKRVIRMAFEWDLNKENPPCRRGHSSARRIFYSRGNKQFTARDKARRESCRILCIR